MSWQLQKPMNLQEIMDAVAEQWKFDEETYPDMAGRSLEEQEMMAIRHVLLHMLKLHPIVDFVEQFEHGRYRTELDPKHHVELVQRARKMAFNSLRLLGLLEEQGENLQWWLTNPKH